MVTRGALTGRGNLTLDSLYLSDGRLYHLSEKRVNNINMLAVYYEIRGKRSCTSSLRVIPPPSTSGKMASHHTSMRGTGMIAHYVYYQLAILGLLGLCVILHSL